MTRRLLKVIWKVVVVSIVIAYSLIAGYAILWLTDPR